MRRKWNQGNYLDWRIASLLGVKVGTGSSRLDPTKRPAAKSVYPHSEADKRRTAYTVVDAYSAAVDILDLQRDGVDVILQAISAEELFVANETAAENHATWQDVFTGPETWTVSHQA